MKRILIVFGVLLGVNTNALANDDFMSFALRTVEQTRMELRACGLQELDPFDPRLPRPLIQADKAIVNSYFQVMAYYDVASGPGATQLAFKAPNGGWVHSITFSERRLQVKTPYRGVFARASRVRVPLGYAYRYYCNNSLQVPIWNFNQCVYQGFVQNLTQQLCRGG